MKSLTVLLAWLSAVLLASGAAQAQSPSTAEDSLPVYAVSAQGAGRIDLGSRVGLLVDASGQLSAEQAMVQSASWHRISQPSPNFGFTQAAHWFRFRLDNMDAAPLSRYIELPIPFIDDVQLFHEAGGQRRAQYHLGDEFAFDQRGFKNQNFVMPVTLLPGENLILIRLASSGTIEAPLRVWDPLAFQQANDHEKLVQGAVAGILLVMVFYNLFVYLATRERSYLYYIGFVASYMLFHFTLTGYTFAYVWPNAVRWNSFAISTCMAAATLFSGLFTSHFLRLREFSRPAWRIMQASNAFAGTLVLATFVLPYGLTVRVGAALTLPVATAALTLGYWRWVKGATFARFYCLAWTAALIGLAVLNASKFGLIETNFWTSNAHQMGVVLLVVLLSFTLADRINHDRALRVRAQEQALAHERAARASQQALIETKTAANLELEQRVAARTQDLNQTMAQLQQANERLQRLSTTDGLTQVRNRAFFDQVLASEYRRAFRLKTALTLILLDIDHFKHINDSYGHLGGDACLRALADLMRHKVQREGDVLARYGGEEFVLLLLNTTEAAALSLAESFRADIEAMQTPFGGQTLRFTASFGVACSPPGQPATPQTLLAQADAALYQAKHDGRNCVRLAKS